MRVRPGEVWRATRTPVGPATICLRSQSPTRVAATAWGAGAEWALAMAPAMVGADDDLDGFAPGAGLVRDLHRRHGDLRIVRTGSVFEAAVPVILEQKVVGLDAKRSYCRYIRRLGEAAPGPAPLLLPPAPEAAAAFPMWAWHACGVEEKRAATVTRAARSAGRLERTVRLPQGEVHASLRTVPGIGVWTAAEVALFAHGDADAVSVGDYHLKNIVSFALAGEPRGTDERMLELLAPYAGHRGRVLRLLAFGPKPPRYGPRMPRQDLSRI